MESIPAPADVRTRSDLVAILIDQIQRGTYQAGDLLPSERHLAEEYGLSRSMVREALRTVSERRLIDIIPGRGSIVRSTTVADAVEQFIRVFNHGRVTPRDLIEARTMIEGTAAGLAAQRASRTAIEEIWRATDACNQATLLVDQVSQDLALHREIVRAAGNPLVEVMFQAIQPYIVEILLRSLTDTDISERGRAYHERIARAIETRDAERAAGEMREHLTIGIRLFGSDTDRDLNLVVRDALTRIAAGSITLDALTRLSTIEEADTTPAPTPVEW